MGACVYGAMPGWVALARKRWLCFRDMVMVYLMWGRMRQEGGLVLLCCMMKFDARLFGRDCRLRFCMLAGKKPGHDGRR